MPATKRVLGSLQREHLEVALAEAVAEAAKAGRWDIVAQLVRELEARRLQSASAALLKAERVKRQ